MTNREIDALIAEKVMGWRAETDANRARMNMPPMTDVEWTQMIEDSRCDFSGDIKVAWEVIDKLIEMGHHPEFFYDKHEWCLHFADIDDPLVCGFAPTAPMAICLAALKAKGIAIE